MIKKLPETYDHQKLIEIYQSCGSPIEELYISSHNGSTYNYPYREEFHKKYRDKDLTVLNKIFKGTYLEKVYKEIDSKYKICRVRFMPIIPPNRRAYSYHTDFTKRLHIPLTTNDDCMFLVEEKIYRMKELGRLYELDTTKKHSALNLSWEPRVHIVFCLQE